jgi:internalin A
MVDKNASGKAAYNKALQRIKACRDDRVTKLDLSKMGLAILPPEIGILTHLEHLDLQGNRLTTLPAEICKLSALQILDLNFNSLTILPPGIGELAALRILFLLGNHLTTVPPEIGKLRALANLWLSKNRLTTLPPEIGTLRRLTQLDLAHNELTGLPAELRNLKRLSILALHGNPGLGIPDSISSPDGVERPQDILNFYFAQQQGAATGTLQPLNEVKVMLVGDGGAGKTSLRRFFKGQPHSDNEPETLGIALDTFTLNCEATNVTIRLWDFAGQEITHALHQFFLTEGCVYLVVVEPRSDNEQSDAEKWLKLIERYGKGAPAVAVLNKQDTRKPNGYDVDRNLLRERFPFIRDFQPTSCGTLRRGCDALLEKLRNVVTSMPEATLSVPGSWIKVKDACFKKGRDGKERQYLTLAEFRELCTDYGERDKQKQESLARILHNLGAVLHFVDEPRLRDTAVLNPHWVTDGVYRLLRYKDGSNSDGILTLPKALTAIPNADKGAARYLLNLMERFEMCFSLDAGEDGARPAEKWLIPGTLDKNQPDKIRIAEWQDPNRVRLRYTYDPLPQGVIPRFIVMTHPMSEGQARWRNGVVLVNGGAKALIRKAQNENTLEVTVQGTEPDRDNLVKVVRGYLARIHRDLPEPKPNEWQELEGMPEEFREIRQLKVDERNKVPVVVETKAGDVKKSATAELNRTSDEGPRRSSKPPLRVFLSYSHEDRREQTHFRKNLMTLQNDGYITFWDDPSIQPGMEWRSEIERELEAMDVFIGLLTTNFRTSNFIQRVEFKRAIERRKEKTAKMWLILVEDCRIEGTTYEGIQVLKPGGRPVKDGRSMRDGFNAAENELFPIVKELWKKQPETDQLSRPEA